MMHVPATTAEPGTFAAVVCDELNAIEHVSLSAVHAHDVLEVLYVEGEHCGSISFLRIEMCWIGSTR